MSAQLRPGTPREVELPEGFPAELRATVAAGLSPEPGDEHPAYPGAVILALVEDRIIEHSAHGYALAYANDSAPLPEAERVPMRPDTIFDLASITKVFTAIAAVQLSERGRLEIEAPLREYLPAFGNGKITPRQLLTHTSGLPAWLPLYSAYATREERVAAVQAVEPQAPPGTTYNYSDLDMILLGKLVEAVSGEPLETFIYRNITGPLGMRDTGYNPPQEVAHRVAATEYQPSSGRGMVRGSVHDENAHALGGVSGHAGLFGTAGDLAILARELLSGGSNYSSGEARILAPDSVWQLFTDHNTDLPGNAGSNADGGAHGLGFELDQRWYMDDLAADEDHPASAGHTGFTGTSLVISQRHGAALILLTNRVHPSREWSNINPQRRKAARTIARALDIRSSI